MGSCRVWLDRATFKELEDTEIVIPESGVKYTQSDATTNQNTADDDNDEDDAAEHRTNSDYDLYKVLDIKPTAQIHKIKASYYRLASIHHPDRIKNVDKTIATEKFNDVTSCVYNIIESADEITLRLGRLQHHIR